MFFSFIFNTYISKHKQTYISTLYKKDKIYKTLPLKKKKKRRILLLVLMLSGDASIGLCITEPFLLQPDLNVMSEFDDN